MTLELRELIEGCPDVPLHPAAGEDGLGHHVTWVHVLESTQMIDYLAGDELILVTGIALQEDGALLKHVKSLYEHRAAGIALDIGHFFMEPPEDVVLFCEEHGFPLFTIPKSAPFENIARPLCRRLIEEETKERMVSAAFQNAISFPDQQELYTATLSEFHFEIEWRYAVAIVQVENYAGDPYVRLNLIAAEIRRYLHRDVRFSTVFSAWKQIIVVMHCDEPQQLRNWGRGILTIVEHAVRRQETASIGVGKLTKSIRCVSKSHRQAASILKLQSRKKLEDRINFFDDLGAYRVLLGIEDPEISREYHTQILGPLIEYDKESDSDLLDVLRCYLNHNGSVKETADELFVHRNTVNYKISKAAEILCMDLSKLDSRLQLLLAFMLMDMM